MAVQKSPVWSDDGFEEERGEDASYVEYHEHNVDNLAIDIVGQHWTSEVISLFLGGLGGRASGIELPICQWTFCAKK